jgi:deazaflavin-dependent oxidoreductase (nitroreductase family)
VDETVRRALHHSQTVDLTTTGRRTGLARRIEIYLHAQDDLLFISGMPRADRVRDWIRNIDADPHVVLHLKRNVVADLPATARVVTDTEERRPLIEAAARRWRRTDVDAMLAFSPLIVLALEGDVSAKGPAAPPE